MNALHVCVIIPVFNAAPYLPEALASVMIQTHPNWTMIVLDDGSTDESLEIARRFAAADPRITVRHDGQNRGLVARLNQMVDLTDAPLIARMDADDIMHPQRLATQAQAFERQPDLDVLGSAAYALDQASQPYGFKEALAIPETTAGFLTGAPLIHPSVMLRREWLAAHPYDPQYERAEDFALWWTTHRNSRLANLPEPLLFYRERGLPYRGKYRRTSEAKRRLMRQIGRQPAWRRLSRRVIAASYLKDFIYDLASWTKLESRLIERRSRPMSAAQALDAHTALAAVHRQVKVVGSAR